MPDDRSRYTVFVVDDDLSVRDSLSLMLSLQGFRTASFACGEDFLTVLKESWLGCVVTDLKMPGMSGLDLQRVLIQEGHWMPVMVITAHGDVESSRQAFKANAVDFLQKPFDDEQIVFAIEQAFQRIDTYEAEKTTRLHQESVLSQLTEREREVMRLLSHGMQNREVAEKLGISPRTVEVHKARILAKLGVHNLAELVRLVDALS